MVVLQVGAPNWPKLLLALMPLVQGVDSTLQAHLLYAHPPTHVHPPARPHLLGFGRHRVPDGVELPPHNLVKALQQALLGVGRDRGLNGGWVGVHGRWGVWGVCLLRGRGGGFLAG